MFPIIGIRASPMTYGAPCLWSSVTFEGFSPQKKNKPKVFLIEPSFPILFLNPIISIILVVLVSPSPPPVRLVIPHLFFLLKVPMVLAIIHQAPPLPSAIRIRTLIAKTATPIIAVLPFMSMRIPRISTTKNGLVIIVLSIETSSTAMPGLPTIMASSFVDSEDERVLEAAMELALPLYLLHRYHHHCLPHRYFHLYVTHRQRGHGQSEHPRCLTSMPHLQCLS